MIKNIYFCLDFGCHWIVVGSCGIVKSDLLNVFVQQWSTLVLISCVVMYNNTICTYQVPNFVSVHQKHCQHDFLPNFGNVWTYLYNNIVE